MHASDAAGFAGMQPCAPSGHWLVHIWNRDNLTHREVHCASSAQALALLDAARRQAAGVAAPVYVLPADSAGAALQTADLARQITNLRRALAPRFPESPRPVHSLRPGAAQSFAQAVQDHLFPPPTAADGTQLPAQRWHDSSDAAGQQEVGSGLAADRPRYLHEATSHALGLYGGAIPSLVAAVLGAEARDVQRKRLLSLLQHPPPWRVASHISSAVQCGLCMLLRCCAY